MNIIWCVLCIGDQGEGEWLFFYENKTHTIFHLFLLHKAKKVRIAGYILLLWLDFHLSVRALSFIVHQSSCCFQSSAIEP